VAMPNILIKIQLTLFTLHGEEWLLGSLLLDVLPRPTVRRLANILAGIYTRLRVGERAFSLAAPRPWNALPTDIKRPATLY